MMLYKAVTPLLFRRTGEISVGVGFVPAQQYIYGFWPPSASSIRPGSVRQASGPTTISTSFFFQELVLEAFGHVSQYTDDQAGFMFLIDLNCVSRFRRFVRPFPIEQVLMKMRSALSASGVAPKPLSISTEATTSVSAKFMAQP